MLRLLKYPFSLLALAACMCASLNGGGSGTNTGNGIIIGKIVEHSGESAEGVAVTLRPNNYLQALPGEIVLTAKPEIREAVTGSDGSFMIDSLPSGSYSVEANDRRGNAVLLKCSVVQDGPATTLDEAVLEPYAAVTGTAAIAPPGVRQYVQIYGLERCVAADSIGGYTFGNLPAGVYTLRFVCLDTSIVPVIIPAQQALPGAITRAPPAGWPFSKKIHLNTTAGGADVAGNVSDFPVLIRLSGIVFDFNQASTYGADLRFAKSDGTPLPFEIERWDATGQVAEIWVKVDTVRGNDSTQSITMYWGNSNVAAISSGESIFDTADGYLGVWHLGESGNDIARDATSRHCDGTPTDTAPQSIPGVIGGALQFDGKSNGLLMKNTAIGSLNFPRPASYTFSAWVSVDSVYEVDEFIAGKGFDQYALRIKGSNSIPANMFALHEYIDAPVYGTDLRFAPVVTRQWKYIVGIRDTAKSYLFIDGRCVDSSGTIVYGGGNPVDTVNFSIGRCAVSFASSTNANDYLPFMGKIDEVRIASLRFSSDWIKLSYMNQKEQDALVKW